MCVHKQKDFPPPYTQKYLRHFTDLTVKPGIESFLTKKMLTVNYSSSN